MAPEGCRAGRSWTEPGAAPSAQSHLMMMDEVFIFCHSFHKAEQTFVLVMHLVEADLKVNLELFKDVQK